MPRPVGQRNRNVKLVFLGTSGALQVPSFHCTCAVCEAARANPSQRRTRASIALMGQETVLVDAGPDLEYQLEREAIRHVDRVFVTHWHFDHVWGLASLAEPSELAKWAPIDVYLPRQVLYHFDHELEWMKAKVRLHPIAPGDQVKLPDATWEVVKTEHTDHSVGFIVDSSRKFAYLVDSITPPPETMEKLEDLDFVILEATVDELVPKKGQRWLNFSLPQAVNCWRQIGSKECILTHLSCHSYLAGSLVAGLSHSRRLEFEAKTPGLKFAYDGLRVKI